MSGRAALSLAALAAGCAATGDAHARAAARQAVAEVVERRFPGAPVTAATDCVIDNASAAEIVRVARDSGDGRPGPATVETVIEVAGRPAAVECLGREALPVLLS